MSNKEWDIVLELLEIHTLPRGSTVLVFICIII